MSGWKVIRTETDDKGNTVELKYAEFGKGRARVKKWEIFRNGEYAGYAAIEPDADENFRRVLEGYVLNRETGRYEEAKDR
ncbi:hypothetical protein [Actinomadura rubrisoli]|uniref:Uncharacterized protein n=1 Tax=Actinomadura rubrisoli TaxID=2530368 RepID=A0A4R5CB74_9ACTN|nr:hypothetical protein [Actinomadura rubrisoli]TDD97201.1 hypothetical protein E1298_01830 [Actinomadura rubrisoli]